MLLKGVVRTLHLAGKRQFLEKLNANAYSTASTNSSNSAVDWKDAKPFNTIPGPIPLPVIGSAWRFFTHPDFNKLAAKLHKQYGNIVNLKKSFRTEDFVFIFDVNDIEKIYRNEGQWPYRDEFESSSFYRHKIRKDIFGEPIGLVNTHGETWSKFRKIVNPIMMQPRTVNQYIPIINDIGEEFLAYVAKLKAQDPNGEMPADFIDHLNRWAFESITAIALDMRLGCLKDTPDERAQQAIQYMLETFVLFLKLDFLPFGRLHIKYNTWLFRRFVKAQDYFTNMVLELVTQAEERIKNDPSYSRKPEHEKSVFERLVAIDKRIAMVMVLDMMGAGIDNISKVIGALLYYLAKNPVPQESLRKELRNLMPNKHAPITKDILDEARYLKACIKESLRFAPIGGGNMRRLPKDMVLSGYQVPKNTFISSPNLYLSMLDIHYTDPKVYKPERWIRGVKTENVNPFVTIPFGFGLRSCIGKRMANMELEIFVAKLIRNYELSWHHGEMRFKHQLLYGIADPLKIRLKEVDD